MTDERKEHILLVDDEKHLLVSLRDYLTFESFTVTTAQSGEEALEVLDRVTPDLIILDISMPGMGGLGFLKRISSAGGKPRIPVLVLTARSMLADFFREVTVDGFVAKPCDEAELLGMIRAILAKHRAVVEKRSRTRRTVLLADSDTNLVARISAALSAAGYDVETVGDGPQLLEKATQLKPDVIVMKEILPRINGTAVAALLAVMPSTAEIPIVLYGDTLYDSDEVKTRYAGHKNIQKVIRAFTPDSLAAAVGEV